MLTRSARTTLDEESQADIIELAIRAISAWMAAIKPIASIASLRVFLTMPRI